MSDWLQSKQRFIAYLLGAILLILITWFSAEPGFKSQLLNNDSLIDDASVNWVLRNANTGITVFSNNHIAINNQAKHRKAARLEIPIDAVTTNYIEFSGWLENLGNKQYSATKPKHALLYLAFLNNDKLYSYAFAERLPAQQQQHKFQTLIAVPKLSNKIRIHLSVRSNEHWVLRDVKLIHAKPATRYKVIRNCLALVWFVLGAVLLVKVLRSTHWLITAPIAFIVISIVVATGVSQELVQVSLVPMGQWVFDLFKMDMPSAALLLNYGHSIMFAIITGLLLRFSRRLNLHWFEIVLMSSLLAAASEAMQRHSFTRNAGLDDLILDFYGIGAALLIYFTFKLFRILVGKL